MTTPHPRPQTVTARIEDTPRTDPRADLTPVDFFVPGARYYDGDGYKAPELTHTFQCEHIALHPRPGAGPRAFGFLRNNAPDSDWYSCALGEDDFARWTRIPDINAPTPTTGDTAPTGPAAP
ncbi:hypothetical protein ACF1AB_39680 [Streptomyces sp. NPDC014846]|uniref:hypothetical protein n=1 Tax=Streptomyces sp. NPDC014846 TaxID=3364922 RepID=UPI0036FA6566